eukprot:11220016-Karenia_brevis.AAC.1
MENALAEDGHRLRRVKCKAWTPGADHMDDSHLPEKLHALYQLVPRVTGGLELLGGAAQGELETHLGPYEKMLGPAKMRAARAMHFIARIRAFAVSNVHEACHQMAWFLLSKSVAHALDYDAKLVPSLVLDSVSGPLCEA